MIATDVIKTIHEHIPSLSDEDETVINGLAVEMIGSAFDFDPSHDNTDAADLAVRTCACGRKIDGFYDYVDHLTAVFGGESHFGG